MRVNQNINKENNDNPVEIRRQRHQIMRCHGLRKYFDTVCVDSDMKHIPKEIMMGHKREQGLDRNYYRPSNYDKLLDEYLKVVNDLTINDENRLKFENEELKTTLEQFNTFGQELAELKKYLGIV